MKKKQERIGTKIGNGINEVQDRVTGWAKDNRSEIEFGISTFVGSTLLIGLGFILGRKSKKR